MFAPRGTDTGQTRLTVAATLRVTFVDIPIAVIVQGIACLSDGLNILIAYDGRITAQVCTGATYAKKSSITDTPSIGVEFVSGPITVVVQTVAGFVYGL